MQYRTLVTIASQHIDIDVSLVFTINNAHDVRELPKDSLEVWDSVVMAESIYPLYKKFS